jgi:NTP pyrophosphatase (non-canonical NTP hydrolase)
MQPSDYIEFANRTKKQFCLGLGYTDTDILHGAIGICGEAGELMDAVKKAFIYGKKLDVINVHEEMGDILWYMAILCKATGTSFEQLMIKNIDKLKARYPEKYTDSLASERLDKL